MTHAEIKSVPSMSQVWGHATTWYVTYLFICCADSRGCVGAGAPASTRNGARTTSLTAHGQPSLHSLDTNNRGWITWIACVMRSLCDTCIPPFAFRAPTGSTDLLTWRQPAEEPARTADPPSPAWQNDPSRQRRGGYDSVEARAQLPKPGIEVKPSGGTMSAAPLKV